MRRPQRHSTAMWRSTHAWLLLAILAAALILRLATIDFGLPGLNDPDELMFELGALRMLRGPTLNPGWFGHPATTTIYVLAVVDIGTFATAWLFGHASSVKAFGALVYSDPSWVILPGRIAMALFALGTIALAWRLAQRCSGQAAGLVAAAVLAVSPVHVTYSQIIRSDMMATFFMLLCMNAAVDIASGGSRRAYGSAALWWGLAVATKWPFALVGLAIGGATLLAIKDNQVERGRGLSLLAGTCVAAICVLFLVSPFLLLDHATVLRNLRGESQAYHLGATSEGLWWNVRWYAAGPILKGLGWGGVMLAAWGVARLPRYRVAAAVIVPVAAGFAVLLSVQHLVWDRWALPLLPLGAILAGIGLVDGARGIRSWLHGRGPEWLVPASMTMTLALVLGVSVATIRVDDRARRTDTRQLASGWARAHLAPGSTVMVEHFAFDLFDAPWRLLFPLGDAGCVDARALLQGKVPYAVIERARGTRSNVDYGTVAPARRGTCRADAAILTQSDRYHRERARFPDEDAAYGALIRQNRVAAVFAPHAGHVGGPVVTILVAPRQVSDARP